MIYVNTGDAGLNVGLGKAKFLKKLQLKKITRQISIKNVIKAAKFAAPLAAGFIPVGGPLATKLLDSKVGKLVGKVKNSKAAKTFTRVKAATKTLQNQAGAESVSADENYAATPPPVDNLDRDKMLKMGSKGIEVRELQRLLGVKIDGGFGKITLMALQKAKGVSGTSLNAFAKPKGKFPVKLKKKAKTLAIGSKGEDVKVLQEELGVKPDGDFGPKTQQALKQATGQKTISAEAIQTLSQTQPTEEVPQGEITAVKPYEELPETQGLLPTPTGTPVAPKNNTVLLVGGAVALAGIAYLATRKK